MLRAYMDAVLMIEPLQLRLWKTAGITLTQLRILRVLRDGPQCAGDLARTAGVSAPSLTRLLDRLAEEGCVERSVSEADRRRIDVALTDAGHRLLEGHPLVQDTAFHRAAESMSASERRALVEALRDFTARVRRQEALAKDAPPAAEGEIRT